METIKHATTIQEKRGLERNLAENAKLKATLDYVALMSDIDIPTEDESEAKTNE